MEPAVETHVADGHCRAVRSEITITDRMCAGCPLCAGRRGCCSYAEDGDLFPSFIDGVRWTDDMEVFQRAMKFAALAHNGMTRKGTSLPYILHPMEAAMIARSVTDDLEVVAAAALHDVVEDTPYTIEDIRDRFGDRVASIVGYESEDKRPDLPPSESWTLRKREFLDGLAEAPWEARVVALTDKLSNMRSIAEDHDRIGDALWDRFNQKDPAMHGWYYATIADILRPDFGDTDAWREYDGLCRRVFGSRTSGL